MNQEKNLGPIGDLDGDQSYGLNFTDLTVPTLLDMVVGDTLVLHYRDNMYTELVIVKQNPNNSRNRIKIEIIK